MLSAGHYALASLTEKKLCRKVENAEKMELEMKNIF